MNKLIRKRVVAAFAAAAASFVPAAAAQAATIYAGGHFAATATKGERPPVLAVALRPQGNGEISVRFDGWLYCGANSYHVSGSRMVALRGGRFSAAAARREPLKRGRLSYRWSVTGLVQGDVARGRFSVRGAIPGHGCRTVRRLPWRARAGAPAGGAVAAPVARGFAGPVAGLQIVASLPSTVNLRVARGGRRVQAIFPAWVPCGRGGRQPIFNFTPIMRIGADGTFRNAERFSSPYASYVARFRVTFAGAFLADGASGTLRVQARLVSRRTQRTVVRCDTGTRAWAAVPEP